MKVSRFYSIILICFLFLGLADTYAQTPLAIGAKAPDFSLQGTDGKTYTLDNFSGAPVLAIVFTCNHCPTAQAYEKKIMQLAEMDNVSLIAISSNDPLAIRLDELGYTDLNDSFDEMKIRAAEHHFNFPYLYDGETQSVAKAYGAQATPHIFIFDVHLRLQYQGRIDDTEKPGITPKNTDAVNAVRAILTGKKPEVTTTKTFGCSMKFSDKRYTADKERENWAKEPVALEKLDENGIKVLLRNPSGKLLLINVWATWCGPCITEFPDFLTMHRMYRGRDFELVTISADNPEAEGKVLKFLKDRQASGKNYLFSGEDKYKLIEAIDPDWQGALPYTLLVEPEGKIVYAQQGIINPDKMRKLIIENKWMGRYY